MSAPSITRTPKNLAPQTAVNSRRGLTMDEVIPHLVGHTIEEVERELILHTLARYCGSRTQSASVLGISIRCIRNKIREYEDLGIGVSAPSERSSLADQESTPSEFPSVELEDRFNSNHIKVTYFPFDRQFHSEIGYRKYQSSFLMEDHMRMLTSSPPSPTATIARCPQCGSDMNIRLIEPDLKDSRKAQHVFECEECGLPLSYLVDREKPTARH
jgi:predicted RNA-binding Zn-ribbon protein involved in translation (DUF1610 family)